MTRCGSTHRANNFLPWPLRIIYRGKWLFVVAAAFAASEMAELRFTVRQDKSRWLTVGACFSQATNPVCCHRFPTSAGIFGNEFV